MPMRLENEIRSLPIVIAMAGLTVAGVFGMASLYPLISGAGIWFYSSITAHLAFALHLWIPAAEVAVWEMAAPQLGVNVKPFRVVRPGLVIGAVLMVIGVFPGWGDPLPIDYAPMFKNIVFAAGMAVVYSVWLLSSTNPLWAWREFKIKNPGAAPPVTLAGFMAASIAAWATAINVLAALLTMPDSVPSAYFFRVTMFGPGHSIQFAHVLLMVTAWVIISGFRDEGRRRAVLAVLFALPAGFTMCTPFIYAYEDPVSQTLGMIWTLSLGMALGTSTLALGITILTGMDKASKAKGLVTISMLCFLVGGAAPSLDDRESLALTAHYHGLLIGVSASYMGVLAGRFSGLMKPATIFGAGGLVMALSFAKLTDSRLLRKTAAMEGIWADHGLASLFLLAGTTLAAAGAGWQIYSFLAGKPAGDR